MKTKLLKFAAGFLFIQVLVWIVIWLAGPVERSGFTATCQFFSFVVGLLIGALSTNLRDTP